MGNIKFYAVKEGRIPGIYNTWNDCKSQVDGFPGAKYKSFPSNKEAEDYINGVETKVDKKEIKVPDYILNSISVDAACSGNPGIMEYRGVRTSTGELLFKMGPFSTGTNNIGEYLALVHGLSWIKLTEPGSVLYTDSKTGLAWLKNGKNNSTLDYSSDMKLKRLVDRADSIASSMYEWGKDKIIKWDTKKWGEIPADFGRK